MDPPSHGCEPVPELGALYWHGQAAGDSDTPQPATPKKRQRHEAPPSNPFSGSSIMIRSRCSSFVLCSYLAGPRNIGQSCENGKSRNSKSWLTSRTRSSPHPTTPSSPWLPGSPIDTSSTLEASPLIQKVVRNAHRAQFVNHRVQGQLGSPRYSICLGNDDDDDVHTPPSKRPLLTDIGDVIGPSAPGIKRQRHSGASISNKMLASLRGGIQTINLTAPEIPYMKKEVKPVRFFFLSEPVSSASSSPITVDLTSASNFSSPPSQESEHERRTFSSPLTFSGTTPASSMTYTPNSSLNSVYDFNAGSPLQHKSGINKEQDDISMLLKQRDEKLEREQTLKNERAWLLKQLNRDNIMIR